VSSFPRIDTGAESVSDSLTRPDSQAPSQLGHKCEPTAQSFECSLSCTWCMRPPPFLETKSRKQLPGTYQGYLRRYFGISMPAAASREQLHYCELVCTTIISCLCRDVNGFCDDVLPLLLTMCW